MILQELIALESRLTDDEIISTLVKEGLIKRVIKNIIIDRVVKDELESISEIERERIFIGFCTEKGITRNEEMGNFLQTNGLTKDELINSLLRPLAIRVYRNKRWESDVLNYYYENKESYDTIEFKMIIVSNSNLAQDLYFRLKDKENSWEQICTSLGISVDSIKYGPLRRDSIEESLRTKLDELKIGQITRPFPLRSGFSICELVRQEGEILTDEIKENIVSSMFEQWVEKETQKTLDQLANSSKKS